MARLLPALLFVLAIPLAAQPGGFGIGGQIGEPTGLTIKVQTPVASFGAAAEWDFGNYAFVEAHWIVAEPRLPIQRAAINYFYGPGLFIITQDVGDSSFGLSGNIGINYYTSQVEFFGQITPRLRLSPDSKFNVGGAVGLRFYP